MDYARHFAIAPGQKVKLKDIDPGFRDKHENPESAAAEIAAHLDRLTKLQYTLYAEKAHSLLIVLQGIDAAGKDGVCRHVITAMNPQGCEVTGFKQPTPEERGHDFLWRVHKHAPELGRVSIFNRSHYEDVLVVRVHKLVPKETWQARYDHINAFERLLVDSGTTVLKFFLWISKEEQLARFKERLDDPARQWKISDSDYTERNYWDDYSAAYEEMLERCSTKHAPWFVIPSNHKWFRNLAVSSIIVDAMEGMKMQMPKPTVDLAAIRKAYHKAAQG
ncbi:MAG: polyphosphate kinase 2 family protein [Proteobacteria bacterium]|nr:polyphosphate kinase 2 family protein [Pseudomonadota bacterium]